MAMEDSQKSSQFKLVWVVLALGAVVAIVGTIWLNRSETTVEAPLPDNLEELDGQLADRLRTLAAEVDENADSDAAWGNLAMAYQANGMLELAETCYLEATHRNSEEARWWFHLGIVAERTGQIEEAVKAMRRATELGGNYAPGFWRLGNLQLDTGDIKGAEKSFRRSSQLDDRDPAGQWGLARALLQDDRAEEAVQLLEKHFERWPNDLYAHQLMGAALRETGDQERARQHLSLALEDPPALTDPWSREVEAYAVSTGIMVKIGLHRIQAGAYREAVRIFEGLRDRLPDDVMLFNNLGQAYLEMATEQQNKQHLKRAMEIFEEATLKHPDHYQAYLNLAIANSWDDRVDEAMKNAERAIELNPKSASAFETKGLILVRQEKPEEALEVFAEAAKLDPDAARYRYHIAMIHCRADRWDEGRLILEELSERFPTFTPGLEALALAHMEEKEFDKAETLLEQARRWGADTSLTEGRMKELKGGE